MIFSYLNFFKSICVFAAMNVPDADRKILVKTASSVCILDHTECMMKELKFNTGWRMQDHQLKASKCAIAIRKRTQFNSRSNKEY